MNYFKNLMIALLGNDPYRMELDRVKGEYGKTAERVRVLEDTFLEVEERKADADHALAEYARKLQDAETLLTKKQSELDKKMGEASSLQTLVENLRDRLDEKDAQMKQMNEEFASQSKRREERLNGYLEQISRLQAQLEKAKKRNKSTKPKKEQTKQEPKS